MGRDGHTSVAGADLDLCAGEVTVEVGAAEKLSNSTPVVFEFNSKPDDQTRAIRSLW